MKIQFNAPLINPFLRNRRQQILRQKFLRFQRARNKVANNSIIRRHLNFLLARHINILKQFFYGRHVYLLDQLSKFFLTLPNFLIFQALVGKRIGFQNLRLSFGQRSLQTFVLSKRDWYYLRNYGIRAGNYQNSLFKGGYNFFAYELNKGAFSKFMFEVIPKRFQFLELTHIYLYPLVIRWHSKTFLGHQFYSFFDKYLIRSNRVRLSPLNLNELVLGGTSKNSELAFWFLYYLIMRLEALFRQRFRLIGVSLRKAY